MKNLTFRKISIAFALGILICGGVSCKKLLEQKPPTNSATILPSEAVQSASDLQEVLISAYDVLANTYNGDYQNMPTLMSDNLVRPINQDDYTSVWLRGSNIFNGAVGETLKQLSIAILRANTVLENVDNVPDLSDADRTKFMAEAHFIRGLCHFDAVRAWAQPYGYTPDNSQLGIAIRQSSDIVNAPRATVAQVYDFVLSEIAQAEAGLPEFNEVYATKWSAIALEAEVRFQQHNYQKAYELSNQLLTEAPQTFDSEVNKYQFPLVSPEAYFYVYSYPREDGTVDSRNGFFRDNYFANGTPKLRIQPELYNLMIAHGDSTSRGILYAKNDQDGNITYITHMFDAEYYHIPLFTVTQMMLMRAESAAKIAGDLSQGIEDINAIRERAYDSNVANLLANANAAEVIQAARLERRLEFPFNGERFHDLKRMGSQGENIIVRGAPWDCNGMILQFPAVEQTDFFPLNPTGGC